MSKEFSRAEQIAALLQRQLSNIIQYQLKDPRINQWVSVSAVKVTADLAYAKIYITILEANGDHKKDIIKTLNHAAGFIRNLLGRELSLYKIPQLQFIYDETIAYGNRLSGLIDAAIAADDGVDKE